MEAHTVCNQDLETFQLIQTKQFEIGYYAQKSPLRDSANEDSLGLVTQGNVAILAVADGVGGHPQGDKASSLVINNFIDTFKKNETLSTSLPTLRQQLLVSLENANKKLLQDLSGAKTTLTACIIKENILQNIQVGDSALLVCGQKGLLKYKSIEHSPVGYAVIAGLLEEKAALQHPERHLVTNVMGDNAMHLDIGPQIELASYDTILLASDGIFDNYLSEQLIEVIRKEPLTEVMQKLVDTCQKMRNEQEIENFHKVDDISLIVCRKNNA